MLTVKQLTRLLFSNEMSDEYKNQCTICLESLATTSDDNEAIVAVYPCGHCFHQTCCQKWQASQLGRRHSKCAACNQPIKGSCRLFLDVGGLVDSAGVDDDDDASLSSCSTSADEAENTSSSENAARDDREAPQVSSHESESKEAGNQNGINEHEVIVLDDTVGPLVAGRQKSSSDSQRNNENNAPNKYKRLAKRFKRRIATLESQLERMKIDHQELCETLADAEQELEGQEEKYAHFEHQYNISQRSLEGANLQLVELRNKHTTALEKLSAVQTAEEKLRATLNDIHVDHDMKIKRAQHTSMAEVRKLADENRALKEKCRELQRTCDSEFKIALGALQEKDRPPKRARKFQDMERATKMAKLLREMNPTNIDDSMPSNRKRPPQEEFQQALKKSTKAAQVKRAIARKPTSRSALELLSTSSVEPPSQPKRRAPIHRQDSVPPSFSTLGINVHSNRRPQTIASRGLLGKKQLTGPRHVFR